MKKISLLLSLVLCSLSLMATNDTIDLALPEYEINYAQVNFYTSAGQMYHKFIIGNDMEDVPELRMETATSTKTHIQGSHEIITESNISRLTLMLGSVETELTFSKALLWLKYTGNKSIDGDAIYDIVAFAHATDGLYYLYKGALPIGAFDEDVLDGEGNLTPFALEDEVDDSVVEPELPEEGPTTAIDNISADSAAQKIFIDGQIYILRGEKVYTLQGQEVR